MDKQIFEVFDLKGKGKENLSPDQQVELRNLDKKLEALTLLSQVETDHGYFNAIVPRFREVQFEKSRNSISQKYAFGFLRFSVAVFSVIFSIYLLQNSIKQEITPEYAVVEESIAGYTGQTVDELVLNNFEIVEESVDNSYYDMLNLSMSELNTSHIEVATSDTDLDRMLNESDIDEVIKLLEAKKIL